MNNLYTYYQFKIMLELVQILKDKELSTILECNPNSDYVEFDRKLTDLYNLIEEYIKCYEEEQREEEQNNRFNLN